MMRQAVYTTNEGEWFVFDGVIQAHKQSAHRIPTDGWNLLLQLG